MGPASDSEQKQVFYVQRPPTKVSRPAGIAELRYDRGCTRAKRARNSTRNTISFGSGKELNSHQLEDILSSYRSILDPFYQKGITVGKSTPRTSLVSTTPHVNLTSRKKNLPEDADKRAIVITKNLYQKHFRPVDRAISTSPSETNLQQALTLEHDETGKPLAEYVQFVPRPTDRKLPPDD